MGALEYPAFSEIHLVFSKRDGELSERKTQCKPSISQMKTDAAHQKRARFSDTDENHFRIGPFDLRASSDDDSERSRSGSRSLFSDSDDTIRPPF